MHLATLCSGGKDSSYAHWRALKQGHEVAEIVAMFPEKEDSWMFHKPNKEILRLYAEASQLPLREGKTTGDKEKELEDLKSLLESLEIEGIVNGAIASTYQKERIEKICKELDLSSINPLWGKDPFSLLREMLKENFEIIITSVAAKGFEKKWLGRKINEECLDDLKKLNEKYGVHPAGEGGEYETLVLDAPFFKKRITLVETNPIWRKTRGHLEISETKLAEK